MYERFTDKARQVMQLANQEAQRFKHEYIGTEHLLLAVGKEDCVARRILDRLGIDQAKIRLEVEKLVLSGPEMVTIGKLPQTPRVRKVIENAMEEARKLSHKHVRTEHLLLGLFCADCVGGQILMNLGATLEKAKAALSELSGDELVTIESKPAKFPWYFFKRHH